MKLPVEFTPLHPEAKTEEMMSRLESQFRSTRGVLAELELPDLLPDGTQVHGNVEGQIVKVTITETNVDIPVVHKLGRATSNWFIVGKKYFDADGSQVDPRDPVDIRDGHKAPGDNVTYLRATFGAPVKKVVARIFLWGKRTNR